MIFPEHCKYIGMASTHPCGNRVYFLSRYLVRETGNGHEIVEVTLDPGDTSLMREITSSRVLATDKETWWYPEKVQLHDRTALILLALENGYRCTIFSGLDNHMNFVIDPDPSVLLKIHVYDIMPPRPSLSAGIRELEATGLFGRLSVEFVHHVRDIAALGADVYPCRAAGFERTLDADHLHGGERVAGCLTGSQLISGCYHTEFTLENTCPLDQVAGEPFIARCCRSERVGVGIYKGKLGAVVHWGAEPAKIAESITKVVTRWNEQEKSKCGSKQ
jgi:hypothetical protein